MAPAKKSPKPETPSSLKGLMIIEASVVGFLSFWVYSEFVSNPFFQSYANIYLQYFAAYVPILALSIGIAGLSATALILRSLRQTTAQTKIGVASKPAETVKFSVQSLSQIHAPESQALTPESPVELEGGPVPVGLMNDERK